ncbi:MAG: putative bifunctional diguanylate cyclase/phosphodiesterase [Rhodocyclaceae bacterium]
MPLETLPIHREHEDLSEIRILVVDDNEINVSLLSGLLRVEGYGEVVGLTDARLVMPEIERAMVDLVLLDFQMPHLDGHEVLHSMRERWGKEAPPVIVITAQSDRGTRRRALELGARDYLQKPFDRRETMQRIRNVLEAHRLYRFKASQAEMLEELVRQRTAELQRLAEQEPVTGMPNRRALLKRMRLSLKAGLSVSVMMIDVDGLDAIGRLHGHPVGECLLRRVAEELAGVVEDGMMAGCWGGGEFLLLRMSATKPSDAALVAWADGVVRALERSWSVGELSLTVEPRVGVATGPDHGADPEVLIRRAALAVPGEGRDGSVRLFSRALEERFMHAETMRVLLRDALVREEFSLVYQPKFSLRTLEVVGVEALIRWNSATLGAVCPSRFIPVAESSGQIVDIGKWVVESACAQLAAWIAQGVLTAGQSVAVNVAARQLCLPHFADEVADALARFGVAPRMLQVEVTESGLMLDVAMAKAQLDRLRDIGVGVAIDDFGTGYSSLAYLKRLPVQALKIDRSFVQDLHGDANDARIVQTIVSMAHSLGQYVVAEGVETEAQVAALRGYGCDVGQGYWYSRPLTPEAFVAFVRSRATNHGG